MRTPTGKGLVGCRSLLFEVVIIGFRLERLLGLLLLDRVVLETVIELVLLKGLLGLLLDRILLRAIIERVPRQRPPRLLL
jgi:hypothetical protein